MRLAQPSLSSALETVLLLAAVGPRELLRRPMLWAGAGIGALIALPTLVWQASNGWPQLQMTAVVAAEADALYGGRAGVAVTLIGMAGVAGIVLFVGGDPTALRPYSTDVRMVADGGQDASVWLCTGRRLPWAELWPRLRTLSVG